MAVNNSLAKTKQNSGEIIINANGENVRISPKMVKDYLVSGNGAVTDQEVVMFLSLCNYQHLNPFIREAYLIKFGNNPATMVVGKDVLLKRAMRSGKFKGLSAGVIVINGDDELIEREGTFVLPNENLVGGWCKVYLNGYEVPFYSSVSMSEYSTGKSNWSTKPATMIRKVALAQALREAFPEEMSALYDASEMDKTVYDTTQHEIKLDESPVEIPETDVVVMPSESPAESVEAEKVISPAPKAKKATQSKQSAQTGIDDIMFPPILDNQPIEI